ncbi:hypothetical protein MSA03_09290 [Microbacterium saccharophilum]|nr:hypothetical protein MSA03_09290 [Microbacterium saccharophilum]
MVRDKPAGPRGADLSDAVDIALRRRQRRHGAAPRWPQEVVEVGLDRWEPVQFGAQERRDDGIRPEGRRRLLERLVDEPVLHDERGVVVEASAFGHEIRHETCTLAARVGGVRAVADGGGEGDGLGHALQRSGK